jgi:uncharacterized protein (DUF58 family)
MKFSDEAVQVAWRAVFSGTQGRIALLSLQSVVAEIIHGDVSALQEHNGRRSFAAQLMALAEMEPVKDETDRKRRDETGRKSRRHGPAGRE